MSEEIYLVADTETTGFKRSGPLIQPEQGRVCQLAFVLCGEDAEPIMEFSSLIKLGDIKISDGAFKAHGITAEKCNRFGLDQRSAFGIFHRAASLCTKIVAHVSSFDKGMMEIEQAYYNYNPATGADNEKLLLIDKPWHCTAAQATDIVKLPPTEAMQRAGRNHFKTPKLEECYHILTGKTLGDNAHDAMFDVRACKDVFFAMRKRAAA